MKKYWRTIHEYLVLKRGFRSHLSRFRNHLSRKKNGISPARRGAVQESVRRKQDRQDGIKSESSEKNSGIIGVSGGGWLFQPADCRSRLREHDSPPPSRVVVALALLALASLRRFCSGRNLRRWFTASPHHLRRVSPSPVPLRRLCRRQTGTEKPAAEARGGKS